MVALADPIGHSSPENRQGGLCQREHRLGQRAEAVADHGKQFALADPIAGPPRKHLGDRSGRFGDAFDQPDQRYAGAKRADKEQRQQAVDHL